VNNQGKEALFQFMIDDNFFNSLTATLVSIDRTFSLRELVKSNPKFKTVLDMLTTTNIGAVLPDFTE
jgi:hypothetical protein